jgi:hypothetical protein
VRVLVACEFSGRVRDAFIGLGCDAWSCDFDRGAASPHLDKHIRGDVRPLLKDRWDLVIAHPPCTYLCLTGVRWLHERKGRFTLMQQGVDFFLECLHANAGAVAVENPIMHRYARDQIGRPTQVVHPYWFGDPQQKATGLWLRGVPELRPTRMLTQYETKQPFGQYRSKQRMVTYQGIADAMATQWTMGQGTLFDFGS